MTPSDLRGIRKRLGLHGPAFARALGYAGGNLSQTMGRLERGSDHHAIPPAVAALALMYDRYGLDQDVVALAARLGKERAERAAAGQKPDRNPGEEVEHRRRTGSKAARNG